MDELNTTRALILQHISLNIMIYNQEELEKLAKSLTHKSVKLSEENRKELRGTKVGQMMNSVNLKMCIDKFNKELLSVTRRFKDD